MNDGDRQLLERIDRELRDTLAVSPSPAFLPRVRERVAEAGARRFPVLRWLVPALAMAGAVLTVVRVGDRTADQPPPSTVSLKAGSTTPPLVAQPFRAAPYVAQPFRAARTKPRTTATVGAPREPEVLVPPEDRLAFERFVAGLHRWRIEEEPPMARAETRAIEDITIAPIEIKPLTSNDEP